MALQSGDVVLIASGFENEPGLRMAYTCVGSCGKGVMLPRRPA